MRPHHFTPAERQDVLDRLVTGLQDDPRVAGVLVVGSGAEGFADQYSDVDLCVVVARSQDVEPAFREWGDELDRLFPVFYRGESLPAPNQYLWVVLLESYLEIDVGFLCLDDLVAKRGRWKTAFDRSGNVERLMQDSWAGRSGPDLRQAYDRTVPWVWHHVIHAMVAARRGNTWQALYEVEQVRSQAIALRGLREGLETKRFRQVDQMDRTFLSGVERAHVVELEPAEIVRALQEAVTCFFGQARHLDRELGCHLAARFERKLTEYLSLCAERAPGGTSTLEED